LKVAAAEAQKLQEAKQQAPTAEAAEKVMDLESSVAEVATAMGAAITAAAQVAANILVTLQTLCGTTSLLHTV
jgi:hypothetical protein